MDFPKDFINKVICGNCIEVMKQIPDNNVDLVVTDPPYNLGKDYGPGFNDKKTPEEYREWFKDVFAEVYRTMKDGYLYLSHSDKGVYEVKPILEQIGFDYIQTLVWWGPNGVERTMATSRWSYRHENILFMKKGDAPKLFTAKGMWYTSVIRVPRPQSNYKEGRCHPTQKPLGLFRVLIQRTPGQIVMDPFSGSGTAAVISKELGRDFIVIEINPEHCRSANRRLGQEVFQWQ